MSTISHAQSRLGRLKQKTDSKDYIHTKRMNASGRNVTREYALNDQLQFYCP